MSELIEQGVPISKPAAGRKSRYPFLREMEVGDSVLITDPSVTSLRLANRLSQLGKSTGRRFTQRRQEDGIRVWRIE